MKEFNFFTILGDILLKKSGKLEEEFPDEFKKHMSTFMLLRYLSMSDKYLGYVTLIQKQTSVLTPVEVYKWFWKHTPKNRSGYISYIKKKKKKKL